MRDGVLNGLNLSKEQAQLVADNVHIVFEGARTSAELIQDTIEPMLERFKPDLLVLDPALSYIGGNTNEQETVGGFLRSLLNPVLQKHNCGVIIVHHTLSRMRPEIPLIAWPPISHISERDRQNGRIGHVLSWFSARKTTAGFASCELGNASGWAGKMRLGSRALVVCYGKTLKEAAFTTLSCLRKRQWPLTASCLHSRRS
jgi:hypothetical protein